MRVLDLFSGLGGFSEAFLLAGDEVMRVESNWLLSEVPCTSMQDVLTMRDRLREYQTRGEPIRSVDVLLAGPPCREFSLAYASPRSIANRLGEDFEPDMTLLEATLEIIEILQPRVWVIENVVGSAEYFARAGLVVRQKHGPHQLYGNFPMFECGELPSKASKDKTSTDPLRSNHKALIPLELSTQLRKAIVEQTTLFDFA
jgi:hypothetical protein